MRDPSALLLLTLATLRTPRTVSGKCEDSPVFTPPSLVVRYGAPASASCNVCTNACLSTKFGLEKAVGTLTEKGTNILWEVPSLTEWGTLVMCYYNVDVDTQCSTTLPITLYQPPGNVSVRFLHGDGPLLEGRRYVLECAVQKVAPLKHLNMTFYKGLEALSWVMLKDIQEQKPVDGNFTLDINATEEDDGAQYWCEAQLHLKIPEVPVVQSQILHTTVHYKPRLVSPPHPVTITVTERQPLELNCSAVGNPAPSYAWAGPAKARSLPNTSVYSIESVALGDEGQYQCTVVNGMGKVSDTFIVVVQDDYIEYMIGVPIAVVVLIIIVVAAVYIRYYKHNRKGSYNLKKVFFNRVRTSP